MSVDTLSMLAGALLSLLFAYVPGTDVWYSALDATRKRLVMLVALLVVAVGVAGLSCAGLGDVVGVSTECSVSGFAMVARVFLMALAANQAAYLIAPAVTSNRT